MRNPCPLPTLLYGTSLLLRFYCIFPSKQCLHLQVTTIFEGSDSAVSKPESSSGAQVAVLSFNTFDLMSATTTTCRLDLLTTSTETVQIIQDSSPKHMDINRDYNCSSPQVFYTLIAGNYTFNVYATDAAGNQEASVQSLSFTVSLAEGSVYTQVTTGMHTITAF